MEKPAPEAITTTPKQPRDQLPEAHLVQWLTVPSKPVTKVYISSRGIPLLCQEPDKFGRVIVTMENYVKWYGIDLLYPDGRVENVDIGLMEDLERELPHPVIGDHCYHPELLNAIAKHYKGVADWRAIEMTTGRWVIEITEEFDFPYMHINR